MVQEDVVERLVRRDRFITGAALALLCALAWTYLLSGAGLGMSAADMTVATLFPHTHALAMSDMPAMGSMAPMPGMDGMGAMDGVQMGVQEPMSAVAQGLDAHAANWPLQIWALMLAMWWIMMIAMMVPSAAPTILLYARVYRHARAKQQIQDRPAPTGALIAGYLLAWLGFSAAAVTVQWGLERAGLMSAMRLWSQSKYLSAGVLFAAGLYQLSPLKNICLKHCRAPAAFISHHWRADAAGAFRMGLIHGGFCIGCCAALMALLFIGGVMNFVWIAALALLVLGEKLLPQGVLIGRITGGALLVWGAATLFV